MNTIEIKQQIHELKNLVEQGVLNEKDIWNSSDFVKYTGLSYSTLTKLTSSREIPFYKPTNGALFFLKSEIIEWITEDKIHSNREAESILNNHKKNRKA